MDNMCGTGRRQMLHFPQDKLPSHISHTSYFFSAFAASKTGPIDTMVITNCSYHPCDLNSPNCNRIRVTHLSTSILFIKQNLWDTFVIHVIKLIWTESLLFCWIENAIFQPFNLHRKLNFCCRFKKNYEFMSVLYNFFFQGVCFQTN